MCCASVQNVLLRQYYNDIIDEEKNAVRYLADYHHVCIGMGVGYDTGRKGIVTQFVDNGYRNRYGICQHLSCTCSRYMGAGIEILFKADVAPWYYTLRFQIDVSGCCSRWCQCRGYRCYNSYRYHITWYMAWQDDK